MLFRITLYTAARSTARLALRRDVQVSRSRLQRLADLFSASFFVHQGERSGAALRFQFRSRLPAPEGKKADVEIADGQRLGLYNLRHSLQQLACEQGEGRTEDRPGGSCVTRKSKQSWLSTRRKTATKLGQRMANF
jgi:hypothetical protein